MRRWITHGCSSPCLLQLLVCTDSFNLMHSYLTVSAQFIAFRSVFRMSKWIFYSIHSPSTYRPKESTMQREMKIRLNMYVRLFIHSMVCKPNHNELKLARPMERNGNATANGKEKNRCTKFSFHFPKGMPLNLPCFCIPFNTRFETILNFNRV